MGMCVAVPEIYFSVYDKYWAKGWVAGRTLVYKLAGH